jgi:arabinofuranan 3-O-arabinosyltransferase
VRRRLTTHLHGRAITLGFVAFSFALAFWQRPGWATSDTKIDLHVDPGRFLSFVASVWTQTTDLGEVHSAQYSGYLWPMGPFYAALHAIGIGAWVTERIWLGALFALSAWGMLKLLDVLIGRPRGVAHIVATAFFVVNPYTTVFTARTTITLLGYAALPWLLLITYHGVHSMGSARPWRGWRGWWWAAAFALILTSTGGGVNAAVVGWMLVGPLVLAIYEPVIGNARWRDALGFLARVAVLGVLASLWWIVPLLVHVRYGIDFLQFTEQPATIWGTNSLTESLRLMGYWTSYIGVGFGVGRSFFSDGGTLLFNPLVVGASLLIPALAVVGFVPARRRSYAPFLLLLAIVGVVCMSAGFPDGTPLRGTMDWIYNHFFVLRFMRTDNKAAPLVAVGVAGLLGLGASSGLRWLRQHDDTRVRRASMILALLGLATLIALASLPLVRGDAFDTQLSYKRIPAPWQQAAQGLNRTLPQNTRALVLPGQIFAYYNWGGTLDAILPRLTSKPVAVRYETPYSDLHAVDLLTTVDDLVQERRLVPRQLAPLLALMGVGAVITGADDDISRSGSIDPSAAAGVLAGQGLGTPSAAYGPLKPHAVAAGDIGTGTSLPEVRRYDIPAGRGLVHVDPSGPATIVDGSAQSVADLAAFGALPARQPLLYAGDLSAAQLRGQAAAGSNLVVGDSNRRQEFLPESTVQNRGPVLSQTAAVPIGAAVINPFVNAGSPAQTVSLLQGARYLRAPTDTGALQFPEDAPIAAFDGKLSSAWVAGRNLPVADRWIEVGFNAPRDVPYVDVYPLDDSHETITDIDVSGVHHKVGAGWTRVPVHLHHVSSLRIQIDHLIQPKVGSAGAGGFREIRIPGFAVRQYLRPPVIIGRSLAGRDLSHDSLSYVFQRFTGDDPFRRNPFGVNTLEDNAQDRGDAETQIERLLFSPAARNYAVDAWVYPDTTAADATLDRMAGYRGPDRLNSSSRFENQPAYRASSAFDGSSGPGWIGVWARPEAPAPWISWSTARALRISRVHLTPSTLVVRRPTQVQVSWPGGSTGALSVSAAGDVILPQAIRARSVRLTVLAVAWPHGASARQRASKAVGIGAVSVPGLRTVRIPTTGPLHAGCGSAAITVGGREVGLRVTGTVSQLDAGTPLRAQACASGGRVAMGSGIQRVTSLPAPFTVDLLRLSSPAPVASAPPVSGGHVLNPGTIGTHSLTGVKVSLRGPSWLVLGESFDAGWRAQCNGRALGAPQVLDGYGNGWLAPADCTRASFSFTPQSGVSKSYVVSGIACVLMLALLLFGSTRAPVPVRARTGERLLAVGRGRRHRLGEAAALALLASIPFGYVFAIRAGAAVFLGLTFVLWRGYGPRKLVLAAAALLGIVVPIIYVVASPRDRGGANYGYATETIFAHWTAVAAIVLLSLACWQMIRARDR